MKSGAVEDIMPEPWRDVPALIGDPRIVVEQAAEHYQLLHDPATCTHCRKAQEFLQMIGRLP